MNRDARILTLATPKIVGPDVDRLHEELSQLGVAYRRRVQQDVDAEGRQHFGEGTANAVTAFQEANRARLEAVGARSLDGSEDVRWSGSGAWSIRRPRG